MLVSPFPPALRIIILNFPLILSFELNNLIYYIKYFIFLFRYFFTYASFPHYLKGVALVFRVQGVLSTYLSYFLSSALSSFLREESASFFLRDIYQVVIIIVYYLIQPYIFYFGYALGFFDHPLQLRLLLGFLNSLKTFARQGLRFPTLLTYSF